MRALVAALALLSTASAAVAQESGPRLLERGAMSRAKGESKAAIMIYEIADFQCPYCARFAREVFPRIDSAYVKTGKVQWFFVNLPLPNHANAWAAAEAALCAGATADKFWPVHDRLFAAQAEWAGSRSPATIFTRIAREAGVPADAYAACVNDDAVASLILQDVMYAARVGVSGTPAFIVNNETSFVGLKTFEEWKEIIEKAVKR